MKNMSVGEFKAHFSEVLEEVKAGEKVGILYGRSKKPVAMIVPFQEESKQERPLGLLKGMMSVTFSDNWEMTAEELLGLKD